MKKFTKYFSIFLFLGVVYIGFTTYPRLDIITGFSAKSMASVVFLAERGQISAEDEDSNFPPINLAKSEVNSGA